MGNRSRVGLALLGSSYSKEWTGSADGLSDELQRNILSIGAGADQGSWVGLDSYLHDDAFQTKAPKLPLWEIPGPDMRHPATSFVTPGIVLTTQHGFCVFLHGFNPFALNLLS